ncbi:hypothetical protein JCM19039_3338 [Geomicrobium sp. JCM 19039]|nr:hypothetical protein JCM19039_3338 [Geomicrobium sp. JCM 19039]
MEHHDDLRTLISTPNFNPLFSYKPQALATTGTSGAEDKPYGLWNVLLAFVTEKSGGISYAEVWRGRLMK